MWNYECNETEIMNLRDSMEGVVRKQNSSGLYIDLKTNSDLTDGTEHTKDIPYPGCLCLWL